MSHDMCCVMDNRHRNSHATDTSRASCYVLLNTNHGPIQLSRHKCTPTGILPQQAHNCFPRDFPHLNTACCGGRLCLWGAPQAYVCMSCTHTSIIAHVCCAAVPHWHSISMTLSSREAACHHVLLRPAFSLPRNNNQGHTNSCSTADSFTPCCKKTPGIFAAQLQAPPPKLEVSLALPMPCQSPTQVTATAALPIAGSRIAVPCRRYASSMSSEGSKSATIAAAALHAAQLRHPRES